MRDEVGGTSSRALHFETFTIDLSRSLLLRDQQPLPLRRQSFDVLRYLVEARGRAVTIDELVGAVWSVRPAQPQVSVTQCIKDIRHAMGDDARWMIRTVPGKGYEFKAAVKGAEPATGEGANQREAALPVEAPIGVQINASASSTSLPSDLLRHLKTPAGALSATLVLVVLAAALVHLWRNPLAADPSSLVMMAVPTLSVEPLGVVAEEHKAHATILGEHITRQLSRSPGSFELSVQAAARAGSTANTRYALRGRVSGSAARREVIVHLVERRTNRELWSDRFATQDDTLLPAVASQIARMTAVHIRQAESRRPLPPQPEASHYALLGRVLLESERGPDVNRRAMAAFAKALTLDERNFYALQG